jgi:hypothetical protein
MGTEEETVKFPEVKRLDPLIRTCHHRLVQLVQSHQTQTYYGDELKTELTRALTKLAEKINQVDDSRLSTNEKGKIDEVHRLSNNLYQDLTTKTRIGNTAINLAWNLANLLDSLIKMAK